MASKVIHAIYNDDDILMHAVKQVRAEKYHIEEVYTPFSGSRAGQSNGIGSYAYRDYFVYIWNSWTCSRNYNDEFYND